VTPPTVPYGDCEGAIEVLQARGTIVLIEMENHFRVGVGDESMTPRLQFGAQLDVVVDLTVVDDP
jgi:hypothetical protein